MVGKVVDIYKYGYKQFLVYDHHFPHHEVTLFLLCCIWAVIVMCFDQLNVMN